MELAREMDNVLGVNAKFLRGNDSDLPFRIGWGSFLAKYFRKMPPGYTSNYFFEFSGGSVTMRRLTSTPDAEATTVILCDDPVRVRNLILIDLFGTSKVEDAKLCLIRLPKHEGVKLKKSKLKSLSKKYFSIPERARNYYPVPDAKV